MKCPICGEKIEHITDGWCNCKNRCTGSGSISLWQELICTRKALDVAKDTIRHVDWFFDGDYNVDAKTMHNEIKCAIKGITALEQKDK